MAAEEDRTTFEAIVEVTVNDPEGRPWRINVFPRANDREELGDALHAGVEGILNMYDARMEEREQERARE